MKGYTDVHLEEKCRRAERKDIVNSFGPDIWALARSWPHYNLSGTSCPASRLSEQLLVCTLYNLPQNPLFSPFPNLSPDSRWNCLVHPSYEFMITMYFYSYYFLIYPQKKKNYVLLSSLAINPSFCLHLTFSIGIVWPNSTFCSWLLLILLLSKSNQPLLSYLVT